MNDLRELAKEGVDRLAGRPLPAPGARPRLLACRGDRALVLTSDGLMERAITDAAAFDLSALIDHTLLKADARAAQLDQLCDEALEHGFAAVCVNPAWVARAAARLRNAPVRVCTVVGFPLGATTAAQKAAEAASSLDAGAREVDMVLPLGPALDGDWKPVEAELALVRKAVPRGEAVLKLILETCLLDEAQKIRACQAAVATGLDFVKTSTGFSTGGATEADVALMRRTVGTACGVKASGGIRTYREALRMVQAGATRLGLSASVAVVQGGGSSTSGY